MNNSSKHYSREQSEVTPNIISRLEKINPYTLQKIFQNLLQENQENLIKFENLLKLKTTDLTPSSVIRSSFAYYLEVKTEDELNQKEIEKYLSHIAKDSNQHKDCRLFFITSDENEPEILKPYIENEGLIKIHWFNFKQLTQAINDILENKTLLLYEEEKQALNNLLNLIKNL